MMVDSRETTGLLSLRAFATNGDILNNYLLKDISNLDKHIIENYSIQIQSLFRHK
jgi:hypothetical protein